MYGVLSRTVHGVPGFVPWALLFAVLAPHYRGVSGQFPAVCAQNATLPDARCCPIPPGYLETCGGYPRGKCSIIPESNEDYSRADPETYNDDRFEWPLRFFKYGCECFGNFAGYMCHECRYGYTGPNCTERILRVRKDFKKVTAREKRYILSAFEKARATQSDYVLLDVTKGADPVQNVSFVAASVYDYLAYVHYYASRKTIFDNSSYPGNQTGFRCDQPHFDSLDFAHRGTNFPLWHRYYMILWEKEMQKLTEDVHFTFPYWNWTDAGVECEICTDDFLGTHDQSGRVSLSSPVSRWYALCVREEGKCEACDTTFRFQITRTPGRVVNAPRLPTAATVNFALTQDVYDFPDYTTNIPNASFRGCLEGYVGIPNSDVYRLHNEVHLFFGGVLNSATSASWDPIFYFHHSFMDKLLEIWFRRTGALPTHLPLTGSVPGHHRNSYLMAYFPIQVSADYFRRSEELGYTYDDMITSHSDNTDTSSPSPDDTSTAPVTSSHSEHSDTSENHEHHHEHYHSDHNHHHDHHDHDESSDVTISARLMQTVAIETALLVVLLLVVISTCGLVFSRRSSGYSPVPSHDLYENGHCNQVMSAAVEPYSDLELDNTKS